jgi:hypothetical protein
MTPTNTLPDVRFGSKADIGASPTNVRFTPKSGHRNSVVECPLCAKSRHSALRQKISLFDHRARVSNVWRDGDAGYRYRPSGSL